ncbi:hypothetical protein [Pseudodesulfovibrio indicus]|uniref:Uncharacterized protein n=1 Tax=Pseudodesulfovibrio indicus TaxID=1716143 RepID=A0A126QMB8_9BACT|nr:hypothetical protein [Pseudodesulfovibrio indicus]AMK11223.1 hypothetical protein AWY79_08895 [Pseudodesulfovibrio indicus]TDT92250.1 hypothetical protein EDC59_101655 [Pseudodesulfovibrio indicus]
MRDFWTFIGAVVVGILAVTGVYALEEDEKPRFVEHEEDELEDEIEEETADDERLIVRAS